MSDSKIQFDLVYPQKEWRIEGDNKGITMQLISKNNETVVSVSLISPTQARELAKALSDAADWCDLKREEMGNGQSA